MHSQVMTKEGLQKAIQHCHQILIKLKQYFLLYIACKFGMSLKEYHFVFQTYKFQLYLRRHKKFSIKLKFSIKDFFSKCDQICSFQQIWSHLLKKPLMENFIFRAELDLNSTAFRCGSFLKKNIEKNTRVLLIRIIITFANQMLL